MEKRIIISGKRKTAVARAEIKIGDGKVTINRKNYSHMHMFDRLRIEEPLKIAQAILGQNNFDIIVNVRGGGQKGQIEAARLAIARAIVEFSKSAQLKKAYTDYDRSLLIADVRRKESYKPGDSKARAKRQKSYR